MTAIFFCGIDTQKIRWTYYSGLHPEIKAIPQGFEFDIIEQGEYTSNDIFNSLLAGGFCKNIRDSRPFLDSIAQIELKFN